MDNFNRLRVDPSVQHPLAKVCITCKKPFIADSITYTECNECYKHKTRNIRFGKSYTAKGKSQRWHGFLRLQKLLK